MTAKTYNLCIIPGDGIGKEITVEAERILDYLAERFAFKVVKRHCLAGGAAIDQKGVPLPAETVAAARQADAVLLGAVGGPAWDGVAASQRPEKAILGLREALGLYANLRPAKLYPALAEASPLHPEIVAEGIDILFVRELTGGIYFGERGRTGSGAEESAFDTERYAVYEIERIARRAFEAAEKRKKKLTSVDKANVLASSRLWRETVNRVAADYPAVSLDHLYIDNAAMQLIKRPASFDVILTSNIFGDILSDEAAMITGSIGLLPSASLGQPGTPGLYEPIHGSAPDIAGTGRANPLACILSLGMLLRYDLGEPAAADLIEQGVAELLQDGWRTADLLLPKQEIAADKLLDCRAMTDKLLDYLR